MYSQGKNLLHGNEYLLTKKNNQWLTIGWREPMGVKEETGLRRIRVSDSRRRETADQRWQRQQPVKSGEMLARA